MAQYKNETSSMKGVVALVDGKPVAVKIAAGATTDDIELVEDHPAVNFHLGKGHIVEVNVPAPEKPAKKKKSKKAD